MTEKRPAGLGLRLQLLLGTVVVLMAFGLISDEAQCREIENPDFAGTVHLDPDARVFFNIRLDPKTGARSTGRFFVENLDVPFVDGSTGEISFGRPVGFRTASVFLWEETYASGSRDRIRGRVVSGRAKGFIVYGETKVRWRAKRGG